MPTNSPHQLYRNTEEPLTDFGSPNRGAAFKPSNSSSSSDGGFGETIPDFRGATDKYLSPEVSCEGPGQRPPAGISNQLYVAAFERRLKSLPREGSGYCAKGVRTSLNVLFGGGPENGPNAKNYTEKFLRHWRTKDSCYQKVSNMRRTPQDFDIRVLQPGSEVSEYGHIEIFFKGKWYSDFQQRGSLAGRHYPSYATYRFSKCSQSASNDSQRPFRSELLHLLARAIDFVVPPVEASEHVSDDSKPAPSRDINSVTVRDAGVVWRLVDRTLNQGVIYILQKGTGKSRREIARDTNSAFILLQDHQSELGTAAPKLADAYVKNWIRTAGKKKVQEVVSQLESVTALERDAYAKNGLKLSASAVILKE